MSLTIGQTLPETVFISFAKVKCRFYILDYLISFLDHTVAEEDGIEEKLQHCTRIFAVSKIRYFMTFISNGDSLDTVSYLSA